MFQNIQVLHLNKWSHTYPHTLPHIPYYLSQEVKPFPGNKICLYFWPCFIILPLFAIYFVSWIGRTLFLFYKHALYKHA